MSELLFISIVWSKRTKKIMICDNGLRTAHDEDRKRWNDFKIKRDPPTHLCVFFSFALSLLNGFSLSSPCSGKLEEYTQFLFRIRWIVHFRYSNTKELHDHCNWQSTLLWSSRSSQYHKRYCTYIHTLSLSLFELASVRVISVWIDCNRFNFVYDSVILFTDALHSFQLIRNH